MSRQEHKLDTQPPLENHPANSPTGSPDDLYAIVPPDPNLPRATPPITPIIPRVVAEDEDDSLAAGRDFGDFLGQFHFQFTLSDLFILTTALAVLLGIMSLLRWKWQIAAGLAGIGAFVSLLVITIYEPERRIAQTIWWTMLSFYLLACLAAFIAG